MDKLSEHMRFNLTPSERAKLTEHAEAEQRPVAWIVRRAVLAYLNGGKAK